jgi:hypothetical protein
MYNQSNAYTVRYESDRQVTRIYFEMPSSSSDDDIVVKAAGLLFMSDCCPGENFCVYRDDDKNQAVMPAENLRHYYYRDNEDLWPSDESKILDG